MAAETQYTANTGKVTISTANSNLDGTGTLGTLLTGASNGTLIKTIIVKATVSTTEGMVRVFIYDGSSNTRLLQEIPVPSVTIAATTPAFEYTWDCDIKLEAGWELKVSTENSESFNVIAQGLDWAYYASTVRPESTNFTANTGMAVISTANSNLDGTGTLGTIFTAGASGSGWKGARIESINIKAIQTTTRGMIRLFIDGGGTVSLVSEIPVPAITRSSNEPAFECRTSLGNFNLNAGYSLKAATQNAESFAIIVEGNDWKYPA
jgi:hypothetical protein